MKATAKIRQLVGTDLKSKVVLLLIAFVCCLLLLLLLIQLREYLLLSKDLEASRLELAHVERVVAAQEKEQKKLLEANKNRSELESFFHLEMRQGTPLVLLGQLSAAQGVQVIGLTPDERKEHSQLIEIPLVLVVRGDYLDLLALCQELENDALEDFTLIRYIKITAYRDQVAATKKQTIGLSQNTTEAAEKGTEQASPGSNMVDAELGISIFTAITPQDSADFEWEKGSQPSIFYQPALEPPTTPEQSPSTDTSATLESPIGSEPPTTPEQSPSTDTSATLESPIRSEPPATPETSATEGISSHDQ